MMSVCRVNISILILVYSIYFASASVPVLIWESNTVTMKEEAVPALGKLSADDFTNHITKKVHVHKPLIVVFLEETLSVEDFSWQDVQRKGSFPQLKNITSMSAKIEFLPSVEDPLESLKEVAAGNNYKWDKYDGKTLPDTPGVILEVKMEDPSSTEDRPDLLRRHDGNIAEVYSQLLAKHSRIVAIFTGKQSSWVELENNRVRRDNNENSSEPIGSLNFQGGQIRLSISKPPLLNIDGQSYDLKIEPDPKFDSRKGYQRLVLMTTINGTAIKLRLKYDEKEGETWSLSSITFEKDGKPENLSTATEISAPKGASVRLTKPVVFSSALGDEPVVTLTFYGLITEAWSNDITVFSTPHAEETPFFTAPIWSGIMITFLLAIIFTWGITMLMDIKTMDRFDDPKGKTISVNTGD